MPIRVEHLSGFIILLMSASIGVSGEDEKTAGKREFQGTYHTLCRVCKNADDLEQCRNSGKFITCPQNKTTCLTEVLTSGDGIFTINRKCVRKKHCRRKWKSNDAECTSGYVRKQCRFCCQGYDCDNTIPTIRMKKDCGEWSKWSRCTEPCKGKRRRRRKCMKYELVPGGNMLHFTPVRPRVVNNDTHSFIPDSFISVKKRTERAVVPCYQDHQCNVTTKNGAGITIPPAEDVKKPIKEFKDCEDLSEKIKLTNLTRTESSTYVTRCGNADGYNNDHISDSTAIYNGHKLLFYWTIARYLVNQII